MHAVTAWRARRGCDAGRSRPDTGPQPRYAHAVTAPPPKLVVRSPAKLNLALSVGAPGAAMSVAIKAPGKDPVEHDCVIPPNAGHAGGQISFEVGA